MWPSTFVNQEIVFEYVNYTFYLTVFKYTKHTHLHLQYMVKYLCETLKQNFHQSLCFPLQNKLSSLHKQTFCTSEKYCNIYLARNIYSHILKNNSQIEMVLKENTGICIIGKEEKTVDKNLKTVLCE